MEPTPLVVFSTMFFFGFLLHFVAFGVTFLKFVTDRLDPAVDVVRHLAYSTMAFGAAGAFLYADAVPFLIRLIAGVGLILIGLRVTRDLRRDLERLRP
jgi:hypothetical protein